MKRWQITLLLLASCSFKDFYGEIADLSDIVIDKADYKIAALKLARENRQLRASISDLQYQLSSLERERNFLNMKLDETRGLASTDVHKPVDADNDLVNYAAYKWDFNTLISLADKEFNSRNLKKSAQLYRTASEVFKVSLDENSYFKAGIASFESGYNDWSQEFFGELVSKFSRSQYFRPSKLWLALTYQRQGNKEEFEKIKAEFRLNYQNSEEWKILESKTL